MSQSNPYSSDHLVSSESPVALKPHPDWKWMLLISYAFSAFWMWVQIGSIPEGNGCELDFFGFGAFTLFEPYERALRLGLVWVLALVPSLLTGACFWRFYRNHSPERKLTGLNFCYLLVSGSLSSSSVFLLRPFS